MPEEQKNSFVLYTNYYEILKDLTNEEAGILFKAILEYQATRKEPDLIPSLKLAFKFIKNQFDIDDEKYKKFAEKQRNNGLKGGRPKKIENPKNPTLFSETQKSLNVNDNVNVNVNDNVNVNNNNIHHPFGNFQNVYLTEKQKKEFECLVMDKKTAEEIINSLSENIACKKEQIFDEEYPDMHLLRLKKYWQFRRNTNHNSNNMSFTDIEKMLSENAKKIAERRSM